MRTPPLVDGPGTKRSLPTDEGAPASYHTRNVRRRTEQGDADETGRSRNLAIRQEQQPSVVNLKIEAMEDPP